MSKSVSKSTKSIKPEEVKVEQPVVEEKSAKKVATKKAIAEALVEPKSVKKVAEPVVAEEPKSGKKSVKKVTEPVAAEEAKSVKKSSKKAAEPAAESEVATEPKQRREVTRESVDAEFDSLVESIDGRLEAVTTEEKKSGMAKFLRTLFKRVKVLKADVARISKQRVRGTRQSNTSSGFMKPVKISNDMAGFTGWNAEQLRSRVEVTKYICDYIKEHNLQNPEDRRQIVPDNKLSKLLGYDKKKEEKPLTYYYLQQKIQPHFESQ